MISSVEWTEVRRQYTSRSARAIVVQFADKMQRAWDVTAYVKRGYVVASVERYQTFYILREKWRPPFLVLSDSTTKRGETKTVVGLTNRASPYALDFGLNEEGVSFPYNVVPAARRARARLIRFLLPHVVQPKLSKRSTS